jgi:hypothetical protein
MSVTTIAPALSRVWQLFAVLGLHIQRIPLLRLA